MIGSGTGLIYILRWFWWRINAYTEIIAMVASLVIALILSFFIPNLEDWQKISLGAILTTSIWLIAAYFTPKEDEKTLKNFVDKINPGGPGWGKYSSSNSKDLSSLPKGILSMLLGCVITYGILIGMGSLLYGNYFNAVVLFMIILCSSFLLFKIWR